jgi:hypothetical protein
VETTKFQKFWSLGFQIFFLLTPFYPLFHDCHYVYVNILSVSHNFSRLYFFFFPFLYFSDLIISIDLSSHSLMVFSSLPKSTVEPLINYFNYFTIDSQISIWLFLTYDFYLFIDNFYLVRHYSDMVFFNHL